MTRAIGRGARGAALVALLGNLACAGDAAVLTLDGPAELAPGEQGIFVCEAPPGFLGEELGTFWFFFSRHEGAVEQRQMTPPLRASQAAMSFTLTGGEDHLDVSCSVVAGERTTEPTPWRRTLAGEKRTTRRLVVSAPPGARLRSDPAGIDCPDTCAAAFPVGTMVTLLPEPPPGRAPRDWTTTTAFVEANRVSLTSDAECRLHLGLAPQPIQAGLRERWALGVSSPHHRAAPGPLVWSADGRSLFVRTVAGLDELDAGTGALRRNLFADETFSSFDLAPDGRTFALAADDLLVVRTDADPARREFRLRKTRVGREGISVAGSRPLALFPGRMPSVLVDLATGAEREIAVSLPSRDGFSPSGRFVYGRAFVADVATGARVVTVEISPSLAIDAGNTVHSSWSADETFVVASAREFSPGTGVWDARTGALLGAWPELRAEQIRLAPWGPAAAFLQNGELVLLNLTDRTVLAKVPSRLTSPGSELRFSPDGSAVAVIGERGDLAVFDVTR